MDYSMILTSDQDRVRTVTLNRPEKLNALANGLVEELVDAIETADRDDEVNVILITGAGRGFCAGLDLTQPRNGAVREPGRWERQDDISWIGKQALTIMNATKPVVAAINGAAAGAGLSIALNADIRVMAAGARVTTGYARRGLSPDDTFRQDAHTYAAGLAANAPIGMTNSKRLIRESLDNPVHTQLKRELTLIRAGFQTEDVTEGMRAFAEKRQPVFRGR